ncbi:hypothetical protein BAY59_01190 [Prauserella coralliicola]|nr:hypothetical protein [Prauserella sp. PE36]PXY34205.1 hypothetical protein BAY59_01190 [Prauserella coralliicola]
MLVAREVNLCLPSWLATSHGHTAIVQADAEVDLAVIVSSVSSGPATRQSHPDSASLSAIARPR